MSLFGHLFAFLDALVCFVGRFCRSYKFPDMLIIRILWPIRFPTNMIYFESVLTLFASFVLCTCAK